MEDELRLQRGREDGDGLLHVALHEVGLLLVQVLAQPVVHRQRDVVRREVLIQPIEQPADDDSGRALDQRSRRSLRPMHCRRRAQRLECRAGTQRTA